MHTLYVYWKQPLEIQLSCQSKKRFLLAGNIENDQHQWFVVNEISTTKKLNRQNFDVVYEKPYTDMLVCTDVDLVLNLAGQTEVWLRLILRMRNQN